MIMSTFSSERTSIEESMQISSEGPVGTASLCILLIGLTFVESVEASPVELENGLSVQDEQVKYIAVAVIGISVIVVTVIFVVLCGGCTPMEVGSEGHSAAGGGKNCSTYQYDSVATDANTRVMNAGTSLPNDPFQHQDNSLPYAIHPQGIQTANNFAGYNEPANALGYSGPGNQNAQRPGANQPAGQSEPPPPNYYEATRDPGHRAAAGQSYGW